MLTLSWQIEFVKDKKTKEPFDSKLGLSTRVQDTGLEPDYGVSLYAGTGTVAGVAGDHVLLAPPYNVSKEEIDIIVDQTVKIIDAVFASLGR